MAADATGVTWYPTDAPPRPGVTRAAARPLRPIPRVTFAADLPARIRGFHARVTAEVLRGFASEAGGGSLSHGADPRYAAWEYEFPAGGLRRRLLVTALAEAGAVLMVIRVAGSPTARGLDVPAAALGAEYDRANALLLRERVLDVYQAALDELTAARPGVRPNALPGPSAPGGTPNPRSRRRGMTRGEREAELWRLAQSPAGMLDLERLHGEVTGAGNGISMDHETNDVGPMIARVLEREFPGGGSAGATDRTRGGQR